MDTTRLTDVETNVLAAAEAETGCKGLTLEHRIADLFKDSLEYVSFAVAVRASQEAIVKAETLGDLANALVLPN